MLIEYLDNH